PFSSWRSRRLTSAASRRGSSTPRHSSRSGCSSTSSRIPVIAHSRPTLSEEDVGRVARVVRSGHLAQGEEVAAFEGELAPRLGVPAAAAVSSGSAALELALRALGAGAGDEVVVPTYACDALHHAVTRCGATPVLADADPETLGLSPKDAARRRTRRTRAIVAVHPFGLAVGLDELLALGVPLVEDCAQAIGAVADGPPAGSRAGGRGRPARYGGAPAGVPRCRVPADAGARHVYHRFVVRVERPLERVIEELTRRGVSARRPVFRPIHRALGLDGYREAERLWETCLSLPCYPLLTDAEADAVAAALAAALAA